MDFSLSRGLVANIDRPLPTPNRSLPLYTVVLPTGSSLHRFFAPASFARLRFELGFDSPALLSTHQYPYHHYPLACPTFQLALLLSTCLPHVPVTCSLSITPTGLVRFALSTSTAFLPPAIQINQKVHGFITLWVSLV